MEKKVFASPFVLGIYMLFFLGCNGLGLEENKKDTFFEKSKENRYSIEERIVAVDSFLLISKASKDTLSLLKGLSQKSFLLRKKKNYEESILIANELLNLSTITNDTGYKIKGLDKLSRNYWNLKKINEFEQSTNALLKLSKINNDTINIAKANFRLARLYNKENKKLKAFDHYNEAFRLYQSLQDSTKISSSLLNMTNIQKSIGDFSGSLETATESLKYSENTGNVRTVFGLYQAIATAFREQNKYDEALKYNHRAMRLVSDTINAKKVGESNILTVRNTEANIYRDQKNYDKAVGIYNNLLLDSLVLKSDIERARVQSNLGYTLWLQGKNNEQAENHLQEALEIRKKINDIGGLIASNIHLTQYYENIDKGRALQFAQEALKNSKEQESLSSIKESLGYIIDLKDNSTKEAKLFKKNDEELTKLRQETRDIYAATRFDIDKKEEEILALEIKNVKNENKKILSYIIALVIGFFAILYVLYLIRRHKREKAKEVIKETFQTERRLSKKVHDELANDMSSTLNFIDNHAAIPKDVKTYLVNKMEELYERSRDVSAEIGGFDNKNFAKSLKFLITQYNSDSVRVITNVTSGINWEIIPDHKKINIYRSLQELLVNTKKHSKATSVTVIFKSEGKKHFINYTDNGEGFEIENVFIRGLQNVETRIKNIGGNSTFNTSKGNGFKARLQF